MILTASPIELAWKPILLIPLIRSSTVTLPSENALKSNSSTCLEPAGISSDFMRTAAAADWGGDAPLPLVAIVAAEGRYLTRRYRVQNHSHGGFITVYTILRN